LSFLSYQIAEMERSYGHPDYLTFFVKATSKETDRIRSTIKRGRAHDITLFISKDDGDIFISKHFYPPGLYRAPSGGVHPDEDFITGARREALEETGVEIELQKYILRIDVKFQSEDDTINWTSHIFTAKYKGGEIMPQDAHEIKEARLIQLDEVPNFKEIMLKSGNAGFRYRAFLTNESIKRL
jgi:ADP-ribose pyrophosphatase YjhB (NUDIX family)